MSFLTVACATGYNPTYRFNQVQVVNLTTATITNVKVRFEGSDKVLNCDAVAKFALCQDHFASLKYPQQVVELSWTHGDGSRKSQQLTPRIAIYFRTAFPLRLVLEANEDGSVTPIFEQDGSNGLFFNT